MGKFLLGVLFTLIVMAGGALAVIYTGAYDVAATTPHTAPVKLALHTAKRNAVAEAAADIEAPPLDDPARIARGREAYDGMCAGCHGGPGTAPGPVGAGLNPAPPDMPHAVGHYSPAELFWITRHGIRMTGMPAWGDTHGDEELWDVVAYVVHGWSGDTGAASPAEGHGHDDGHDDHNHDH